MNKTKLAQSRIHGRGVFALEDIKKDEIIESCPIIFLDQKDTEKIDGTKLYDYYFKWEDGSAIALGNGSFYNHSYSPNAVYRRDFSNKAMIFIALKNIKKDQEITVNYNGEPDSKERVWFETK